MSSVKIILGVTMHNEVEYGPHVEIQLKNAIEMSCYDHVVVFQEIYDF